MSTSDPPRSLGVTAEGARPQEDSPNLTPADRELLEKLRKVADVLTRFVPIVNDCLLLASPGDKEEFKDAYIKCMKALLPLENRIVTMVLFSLVTDCVECAGKAFKSPSPQ